MSETHTWHKLTTKLTVLYYPCAQLSVVCTRGEPGNEAMHRVDNVKMKI